MDKLALASDHAGYQLKTYIISHLTQDGIDFIDCGSDSDEVVDYIDYTLKVIQLIARDECQRGIFFCGNGYAMAMLANRAPGMRAAVCHDAFTARTALEMGGANIISLGARVVAPELAWELVSVWLQSRFRGEDTPRYARRLRRVADVEPLFARSDWQGQLANYLAARELLQE